MNKELKNSTYKKYWKQLPHLGKSINEDKKELRRLERKVEALKLKIDQQERIREKFWDEGDLQLYKGVLIYVRTFAHPSKGNVGHNAHIGALGRDYQKSAEIYVNANDHAKMGFKFRDGAKSWSDPNREVFLGSQFKDFKMLIQQSKDWVVFGDPNYKCCSKCIVYAACKEPCQRYEDMIKI